MSIVDSLTDLIGTQYVLTGSDIGGYGHDWAGGLTWNPICVVRPGNTEEVSAVLKETYSQDIAVVPVAGNTSVSGGGYAEGAVMLSLDRLNQINDINTTARTARVGSGVIVAKLHDALEDHGLVFPLLFGAQGTAQIGGALSTNAGGSNVLRFGNARALCLGIEVVLPDGRVMDQMVALHKDNTGYDLKDLFIGAEGTLGVITGAVLKLFPQPKAYVTAMLAFEALDHALEVLDAVQAASGNGVEAYEYMPEVYISRHMERIPGAREPFDRRWPVNILCQVAASSDTDALANEAGEIPLASRLEDVLGDALERGILSDAVIAKSEAETVEMWARRDAAAELALADKPYVNSDLAVPVDQIGNFLDAAGPAVHAVDPEAVLFWVAHLGDGNVHYTVRISDASLYDATSDALESVVANLGGSFSAEHGIGYFKRAAMTRWKDPVALDVMRAIKGALDPKGLMNPKKIFP